MNTDFRNEPPKELINFCESQIDFHHEYVEKFIKEGNKNRARQHALTVESYESVVEMLSDPKTAKDLLAARPYLIDFVKDQHQHFVKQAKDQTDWQKDRRESLTKHLVEMLESILQSTAIAKPQVTRLALEPDIQNQAVLNTSNIHSLPTENKATAKAKVTEGRQEYTNGELVVIIGTPLLSKLFQQKRTKRLTGELGEKMDKIRIVVLRTKQSFIHVKGSKVRILNAHAMHLTKGELEEMKEFAKPHLAKLEEEFSL